MSANWNEITTFNHDNIYESTVRRLYDRNPNQKQYGQGVYR